MNKILLHCCCAPCASSCIERLLTAEREVLLYFSNSNIAPFAEFEKRLTELQKLSEYYKIPLYVDDYDHESWLKAVQGFEQEPERGLRCGYCFDFSLTRTAQKAKELGNINFTTSLTVSPHKNSQRIFDIGAKFPNFEPHNFKKCDGFKRSRELTKQLELYAQNYCGCEFSLASSSQSSAG